MSSRPVKVQNNNNKIIVIIIITTLASTEHLLGIKFFFKATHEAADSQPHVGTISILQM